MATLTPSEHYTLEKARGILSAKTAIAQRHIGLDDLMSLLNTVSPSNPEHTVIHTSTPRYSPVKEEDVSIPGFELCTPIKDRKVLFLLQNILAGGKSFYPFHTTLGLEGEGDQTTLTLRSEGNFFDTHFRSVAYSIAVDMSKVAKATLYRDIHTRLADAQLYQYDRQIDHQPSFPISRHTNPAMQGVTVKQLARMYIANDPGVDSHIKSHSTLLDQLHFKTLFVDAKKNYPAMCDQARDISKKMTAPDWGDNGDDTTSLLKKQKLG